MIEATGESFITLQHKVFQSRVAVVFPGQGGQRVGMGEELYNYSSIAREIYEDTEQITKEWGYSIKNLSFRGPKETLDLTRYSQMAILLANHAYYKHLIEELGTNFRPAVLAGFSLGELVAICEAGAIDFANLFRLVNSRAESMQRVCEASPGGKMVVTMRLKDDEDVSISHRRVFAQAIKHLVKVEGLYIGSINSDIQIGLGGSEKALQDAISWLKKYKREGNPEIAWVRLSVSGPFHTPMMEPVVDDLSEALNKIPLKCLEIPVIGNTNAALIDDVKQEVLAHLTSPVKWYKSINVLSRMSPYILEPGEKPITTKLSQKKDQILMPIRGNNGNGPILAHILMPRI